LGGEQVLLGNGDGTFQPAIDIDGGNSPTTIAVGDFTGSGILDIAVTNQTPVGLGGFVSVVLGNGDGSFQPGFSYSTGHASEGLVVGDFTGNGILDLAVANGAGLTGSVGVLLGQGDGTFQDVQEFPAGGRPVSLVAGDFNGDGWTDRVTANNTTNNVSVLLNDQSWGMAPRPPSHGARSGGVASAPLAAELFSHQGDSAAPGQPAKATLALPPDSGPTQPVVSHPGAFDSVTVLARVQRHAHPRELSTSAEDPLPEEGTTGLPG
jgi:hypothetical protein